LSFLDSHAEGAFWKEKKFNSMFIRSLLQFSFQMLLNSSYKESLITPSPLFKYTSFGKATFKVFRIISRYV